MKKLKPKLNTKRCTKCKKVKVLNSTNFKIRRIYLVKNGERTGKYNESYRSWCRDCNLKDDITRNRRNRNKVKRK